MAWIEFHPDEIIELQKFQDFRVDLHWSSNEALGFLGRFWGKVLKLRESGDISGWRPDYIVSLTEAKTAADRLEKALKGRWIDVHGDRMLVHDWLKYAGRYLEKRYYSADPGRLVDIWALHGMRYEMNKSQKQKSKIINRLSKDALPTVPDRTKPDQERPLDSRENDLTDEKRLLAMPWKIRGAYYLHAVRDLPAEYCGWALKGGLSQIGPEYKRALELRIEMYREERVH